MAKQQMAFANQQRVQGDVFKALKDAAKIEDLRYKYDNF
jgi:hypothetical protein